MKNETIQKIVRFFIGFGFIALIIWALATNDSHSYDPRDASSTDAVTDEIEHNEKIEYEYNNSLEGKYENGETDTIITEDGDTVVFYIKSDTIKNKNK